MKKPPSPQLSVVLPVYNEVDNIRPLHASLMNVLEGIGRSFEIVYCDDGSDDGSGETLRELVGSDENVKAVFLRRNFGQSAAIAAGLDHARGEIVVLLDADLQNDPADIPKLLAKIDEGFDIASGWRRRRKDPYFSKILPSRIANRLISWVTGVRLHDHGCTLKACRREILSGVNLYGEMHRFLSILGHRMGAKVCEVEVTHNPRLRGKSKYTIMRTFKVLLDLPVLVLLGSYMTRPVHFFGSTGLLFIFGGVLCGSKVLYEKIFQGDQASENAFLLLAVFLALIGVQNIMIGLLAEMMTRVYHESQEKKIYAVRETINLDD